MLEVTELQLKQKYSANTYEAEAFDSDIFKIENEEFCYGLMGIAASWVPAIIFWFSTLRSSNLLSWNLRSWNLRPWNPRSCSLRSLKSEIMKSKILLSEFLKSWKSQITLINQNEVGIYMFVTSCDEHGDGCLHTCYYYRANGQEVCLSEKCSDNFLYVGLFSDFIAH